MLFRFYFLYLSFIFITFFCALVLKLPLMAKKTFLSFLIKKIIIFRPIIYLLQLTFNYNNPKVFICSAFIILNILEKQLRQYRDLIHSSLVSHWMWLLNVIDLRLFCYLSHMNLTLDPLTPQLVQHYEVRTEDGAPTIQPKTRTLLIPSQPIDLRFLPRAWRDAACRFILHF